MQNTKIKSTIPTQCNKARGKKMSSTLDEILKLDEIIAKKLATINMSQRSHCDAKLPNGKLCKRFTCRNGKCKLHGGLTPVKHGNYSKESKRIKEELKILKDLQRYLDNIRDNYK
jgi:hypothetical protein